jgi:hypothetical protein
MVCLICGVGIPPYLADDTCSEECQIKLNNKMGNSVSFDRIDLDEAIKKLKSGGQIIQTKESINSLVEEFERLKKIEKIARLIRDDLKKNMGYVRIVLETELDDALLT